MRWEVRITGLGGQGAITAGHILGRAAVIYDGKEAVVTEGYSPYITGGWSRADVVIADEPIDYPLVTKLDALLTMYQEGLDTNLKLVKPQGFIITEKTMVNAAGAGGLRVFEVPALLIADRLGKRILLNVVMLGALVGFLGVVSPDAVKRALADRFPKAAELNRRAFDAGFEVASRLLRGGEVSEELIGEGEAI